MKGSAYFPPLLISNPKQHDAIRDRGQGALFLQLSEAILVSARAPTPSLTRPVLLVLARGCPLYYHLLPTGGKAASDHRMMACVSFSILTPFLAFAHKSQFRAAPPAKAAVLVGLAAAVAAAVAAGIGAGAGVKASSPLSPPRLALAPPLPFSLPASNHIQAPT